MQNTSTITTHKFISIQILRAIAVFSVIIFHLDFFALGYLGVDLFFVISAFVISQSIDRSSGDFLYRIGKFFIRRVKRIYPLTFASALVSFVIIFFFYPQNEFIRNFNAIISQLIGVQNFYFSFAEKNYFDLPQKFFVNLHTWSLAVEDQFYLIFPFIALTVTSYKLGSSKLFWWMINFVLAYFCTGNQISLTLINFVNEFFVYGGAVEGDATFFMLFDRLHQFSCGASLYFLAQKCRAGWLKSCFFVVSAIISGFMFHFYVHSLAVTFSSQQVATLLFIIILSISVEFDRYIAENFFNNTLSWLGDISFSIYIWHWPLLILLSLIIPSSLYSFWGICLYFASLIFISQLSYNLIEVSGKKINWKPLVIVMVLSPIACLAIAPSMKKIHDNYLEQIFETSLSRCIALDERVEPGKRFVILVGDSHADMISHALHRNFNDADVELRCIKSKLHRSFDTADTLAELSKKPGFLGSIVAYRWNMYSVGFYPYEIEGEGHRFLPPIPNYSQGDSYFSYFEDHVSFLSKAHEALGPMLFVLQVPNLPYHPIQKYLLGALSLDFDDIYQKRFDEHHQETATVRNFFKNLQSQNQNIFLLDPTSSFCSGDVCLDGVKNKLFYWDDDHLSDTGADHLVSSNWPFLKEVFLTTMPKIK